MNTSDQALLGSYNDGLVVLSVVIAIVAAYAALDLAGRVTSAGGRVRFPWLSGGAIAMGTGIWSMHYIGMLAFRLPIAVLYDWPCSKPGKMGLIRALSASIFSPCLACCVAKHVVPETLVPISLTASSSICDETNLGNSTSRARNS
jgi:NO-binding membrane sensor protein with MHYT domain